MKPILCIKRYDPYFGFNIIHVNSVLYVRDFTHNGLRTLVNRYGHMLGTIDQDVINDYFKI